MKYLYTDKPDDWCHEIKGFKGVYGKPVHDKDRSNLLKKGWQRLPEQVAPIDQEPELDRDELALSLGIDLFDENGKKKHYKLIDSAIKEAQSNVEHKEG